MTLTADRRTDPAPQQPPSTRGSGSGKGARNSRIRGDIEGLRAIATFLVLPYHAGLMLFPGGFVGVDVFFVISGFVITGQLLKEVEREGKVSLLGFYARRAKRLLPASAVVLVATALMTYLWVPRIKWDVIGGDIVSSALYFVNFRLADRSVDYLAEDVTPSPVQHYWSLAVEEQFYFVWPLLLLVAVAIAARTGVRRNVVLLAGLAAIAVPSLIWSAHMVVAQPERSYFDTSVRMWEFTIGAFVAILIARLDRMPRVARRDPGVDRAGDGAGRRPVLRLGHDVARPGSAAADGRCRPADRRRHGCRPGGPGPADRQPVHALHRLPDLLALPLALAAADRGPRPLRQHLGHDRSPDRGVLDRARVADLPPRREPAAQLASGSATRGWRSASGPTRR